MTVQAGQETSFPTFPIFTSVTPDQVQAAARGGQADTAYFSREKALALLLINRVVKIDRDHGDEERAKFGVNCGDVFAWGCADAEELPANDIESLYRLWLRDPGWGPVVWCMSRRRELPQEPMLEALQESPHWDVNELIREHGLRPNCYDGVCGVVAERKYDTYKVWAEGAGMSVLPWDHEWWNGWDAYCKSHPGWYSAEWEREDKRLVQEWKAANGFVEV